MTEQATFNAVTAELQEPRLDDLIGSNGHYRKVVTDIIESESLRLEIGVESYRTLDIIAEVFKHLQPIIDALTLPRSIDDFLSMKLGIYRAIKSGQIYSNWRNHIVKQILHPLGVVAYEEELSLGLERHTAESWHAFVQDTHKEREYFHPRGKIVTVEQAQEIIRKVESERHHPAWIGYVGGKWREGIYDGHIDLFTQARRVLGNGLLIATVESERSIRARLQEGEDYEILPDDERLRLLANQQEVDLVILVDPPDELLGDVTFFDEIEAALRPHYRFIGYRNHEYFERIATVCRMLGTILLWDSEEQKRRTTDRIAGLQGKQ